MSIDHGKKVEKGKKLGGKRVDVWPSASLTVVVLEKIYEG